MEQAANLLRWLARRQPAGPGEQAFSHFGGVAVLAWGFLLMASVEAVVLHLVLPWPTVRLVADALSVLAGLWLLSVVADLKMTPHLVAPPGLVVRNRRTNLLLPWDSIAAVRSTGERAGHGAWEEGPDGTSLNLVVGSTTNVEVQLRHPMTWRGRSLAVVRCYADDPKGLVTAALERRSPQAAPQP